MLLASDFGPIVFLMGIVLGPALPAFFLIFLGMKWNICLLIGGVLNVLYSLGVLSWFAFFMENPPHSFLFSLASLPLPVGVGALCLWAWRRRKV